VYAAQGASALSGRRPEANAALAAVFGHAYEQPRSTKDFRFRNIEQGYSIRIYVNIQQTSVR